MVVYSHDDDLVHVPANGGDKNLLCTGIEMRFRPHTVSKETGGFYDDVDTEISPWQIAGFSFRKDFDNVAISDNGIAYCFDGIEANTV